MRAGLVRGASWCNGIVTRRVRRVPLLTGSRIVVVPAGGDDLVLLSAPPPERLVDTGAAVRDALRFPLSGLPLEAIVPRGGRATIVVEHPLLPVPSVASDPRREALAATLGELERCGVPTERQTILVAGGLERRAGARELGTTLLAPHVARAFRGRVLVHDAEDPALVPIERTSREIHVHPALLETDFVLVVGAAETILDGGPGTLLKAADAQTVRACAGADSLLEAARAPEWALALEVEAALARKVALVGVSLVLDLPRLTGTFRGYAFDEASVARIARSRLRRAFGLLPSGARRELLVRQAGRLGATAAFAGTPSVAHAEALVRGVTRRGTRVPDAVDALVVGVPWANPHDPREPLDPVSAAAAALGLALRLRRDAFPIRLGGTLILVHPLRRSFGRSSHAPFGAMFRALREAHGPDDVERSERDAAKEERALAAYRSGQTCHPLLPYADWAGCAPALERLGRVVVAGCRDALAARTLGFVPSGGVGAALAMAHGLSGGRARIGILPAPPYPPLLVG
jgi:hypothetical protein